MVNKIKQEHIELKDANKDIKSQLADQVTKISEIENMEGKIL